MLQSQCEGLLMPDGNRDSPKQILSLLPALIMPDIAAQVFLWPCGALLLMLPFAVLFGFNPTRFTLGIYFN